MLKLFSSGRSRKELDILLTMSPNPDAVLHKRMGWLAELLTWIFSASPLVANRAETELDFSTGHPQALRVKWLLHVLERNPLWKTKIQAILTSIAAETSIFDLLVMAGLHQQSGLISEFVERFQRQVLPRPPNDQNLELLFSSAFDSEADAASIQRLELGTLEGVIQLFLVSGDDPFSGWRQDTFDAISHLALQIAALGAHPSLRRRIQDQGRNTNAFFQLQLQTLRWIGTPTGPTDPIESTIDRSFATIRDVYTHMDENGVSVDLVYHLERMRALLKRLRNLLRLFEGTHFSPASIQTLASSLVFESVHSRSLRALFDDNTALIAKKIAENSAETGEHYIAKNRTEEASLIRAAMGGGAITAVTVIFKYMIIALPGSPFFLALLGSINYSVGFMVLQLQGFTLATKQPAMTAATLADQIEAFDDPLRQSNSDPNDSQLDPMVDEMLTVLRSQSLAVIGNLTAVIPGVFLLCGTFNLLAGSKFLSIEKAEGAIEHFSIFGATPFYAAWTGVLLFISSLCAGWFYHWVLFRQLPQAFARSPRLISIVGMERARKFSVIMKKNAAGFAGNISLGFLLGLSPAVFQFLGLPLDVRHVTLSTGSLVAAVMTLGSHVMSELPFWLAVAGIFSMAVLNLLVSFSLALAVALRSKKVPLRTARKLVRVFAIRVIKRPTLLFRSSRR